MKTAVQPGFVCIGEDAARIWKHIPVRQNEWRYIQEKRTDKLCRFFFGGSWWIRTAENHVSENGCIVLAALFLQFAGMIPLAPMSF